jgi:hypothetical protein
VVNGIWLFQEESFATKKAEITGGTVPQTRMPRKTVLVKRGVRYRGVEGDL